MSCEQELRRRISCRGGQVISESEGPFSTTTFALAGLIFQLVSDYGRVRVNIGVEGATLFPASFWVAALQGDKQFPDPPVTEEDLTKLIRVLPDLLDHAPTIATTVELLGRNYSKAMRDRLA